MTKENKQPIGAKWWLKLLILAMAVLLVLNTVQILNMSTIVARVDKYNQGVIDEMGGFRGNVQNFGGDLNEIRRFLLLPERNYSNTEDKTENSKEEQKSSESQMGLYAFLNQYAAGKKMEENKLLGLKAWDGLIKNPDFQARMKGIELSFEVTPKTEMQAKLIDKMAKSPDGTANVLLNQPIFGLVFSAEENLFILQSSLGDKKFEKYTEAGFPVELAVYVSNSLSEARLKKIADKKKSEEMAANAENSGKANLQAQRDDFEKSLKEPAFVETLAAQSLKLSDKSKQENNKLIYDVLDQAGQVKFSIALEISSGMTKVIFNNQELDAKSFLNNDGSKKKP